ncbi:MAG: hypothetical protein SFY92_09375 [Verrucomicrobiae bacterium]|nr:hypothetical protein [Verrucomicrobiae bacterium]
MAPKNKKLFDAVGMSRKLREQTGKVLFSMSQKERLAHLKKVRQEFAASLLAKPHHPRKAA